MMQTGGLCYQFFQYQFFWYNFRYTENDIIPSLAKSFTSPYIFEKEPDTASIITLFPIIARKLGKYIMARCLRY